MPSANTFKYQTIWTKEYQKSNWVMPVYPVIADMQFKDDLSVAAIGIAYSCSDWF